MLGRDLKTLRPSQVQTFRRSVGFVFQDYALFPHLTVRENVMDRCESADPSRRAPSAQLRVVGPTKSKCWKLRSPEPTL